MALHILLLPRRRAVAQQRIAVAGQQLGTLGPRSGLVGSGYPVVVDEGFAGLGR